jgi:hypothetical protein
MPELKPVQEVKTRWTSAFEMVNWFAHSEDALRMYAVHQPNNHMANEEGKGFNDYKLGPADFCMMKQVCAVLQPVAQMSQMMEGDSYVTASLILPITGRLLRGLESDAPIRIEGEIHQVSTNGCTLHISNDAPCLLCHATMHIVKGTHFCVGFPDACRSVGGEVGPQEGPTKASHNRS